MVKKARKGTSVSDISEKIDRLEKKIDSIKKHQLKTEHDVEETIEHEKGTEKGPEDRG